MSHAQKKRKIKEAEPEPKRKSQNIIRQKPKIYERSLETDFSVVESGDFTKLRSHCAAISVDCKIQ